MNQYEHLFVRSEKEFRVYQNLVDHVFDQNKRLPQQVFRKNFDCFLFQEFDWALSDDILPTIKELSNLTHDGEFLTAVLKPDPVDYYLKEFGYYHWLKASVNISGDDYVNALWMHPKGSIADNIITNSNIVVWLSHSLQWAIWADRDMEICIIGMVSTKDSAKDMLLEEGWKPLDHSVLANWLELLLKDQKTFNEYFTQLLANYS
ncbi:MULTISPECIES: hypothetical protein [Bacillus]|uniref:hypothetical protein n=1 Tax=Bacillus TaxID=1386 RepID=UPI000D0314DC|nr:MULTISPECIES: hypothetical protein [Bacillus]MCK6164479.1 hypothetical protein [Bacillus pumilus]MCK6184985.1 hypothetical protein [Bacillus pumilus]MDF2003473.1 hypothetical protein [Bacillus pumilus]MDF2024398.1 hypothetical protein [Bacillus pumilus]MDF2028355.1 hypothetical protein [Bacillus pumilus]